MNALILVGALAGALLARTGTAQDAPFGLTRCEAVTATLGTIRLPQPVLADGKPLAPGTYQIRTTSEHAAPAAGQSPDAACWIEFVRAGATAGRDVATVIPAGEMAAVAKGPAPEQGKARVDVLKGGEYIRVWINQGTAHYIINLPVAQEARP